MFQHGVGVSARSFWRALTNFGADSVAPHPVGLCARDLRRGSLPKGQAHVVTLQLYVEPCNVRSILGWHGSCALSQAGRGERQKKSEGEIYDGHQILLKVFPGGSRQTAIKRHGVLLGRQSAVIPL